MFSVFVFILLYGFLYNLGKGAVKLSEAVIKASDQKSDFKFLYDLKVTRFTLFL